MPYQYDYPRPAVSVDMVVTRNGNQEILLIQRRKDPFAMQWALPGGFLEMDETLEQAAARELVEETGLVAESCEQFGAFSTVDRDPRGRVITIGFLITIAGSQSAVAADDAMDAKWFSLLDLPELAFDHRDIIASAVS